MKHLGYLCLPAAVMAAPTASAETTVFGNITSDAHWTAAGSRYVLQNAVTVNGAVIDPGVTVRMTSGVATSSLFNVDGALVADATGGSPIIFDSEGAATEGRWGGVKINASATATLKNVEITWDQTGLQRIRDNHSLGSTSISVTGSAITHNSHGTVFLSSGSSSGSYWPSVWWFNSVIGGNKAIKSNDISGTAGAGAVEYNPLYKDGDSRDLTPTHRSPLRYSNGSDRTVGYAPGQDGSIPWAALLLFSGRALLHRRQTT